MPAEGVAILTRCVRESLIYAGVEALETLMRRFEETANTEMVPETLLDEMGGRAFIQSMFVDFAEKLIFSSEFLRDKYEEQYDAILDGIKKDPRWVDLICKFLDIRVATTSNSSTTTSEEPASTSTEASSTAKIRLEIAALIRG